MDNPFGVIRATRADEDAIFECLTKLHGENGMWPMNNDKVWAQIKVATRAEGNGFQIIGLIKGDTGNIEGLIWLLLTDSWYSDFISFNERLLFVVPECRRSTHAKQLVQFAKWCSDRMSDTLSKDEGQQQEIPLIIGIQTFKALEQKMRLYQRQFKQVGATFMHRMVPADAFNQRHIEPHHTTEGREKVH